MSTAVLNRTLVQYTMFCSARHFSCYGTMKSRHFWLCCQVPQRQLNTTSNRQQAPECRTAHLLGTDGKCRFTALQLSVGRIIIPRKTRPCQSVPAPVGGSDALYSIGVSIRARCCSGQFTRTLEAILSSRKKRFFLIYERRYLTFLTF